MSVNRLIDSLKRLHIENARRQYLSKRLGFRRIESMMPATSFVYEYFIYNSIYQVNWGKSLREGVVVDHSSDTREMEKQNSLLDYMSTMIRELSDGGSEKIFRAFFPLSTFPDCSGRWTAIIPDNRITYTKGKLFFEYINNVQRKLLTYITKGANKNELLTIEDFIKEDSLRYIYYLRNNIFHGTKDVSMDPESDHMKRVMIYDAYLKGVTSLFFLLHGERSVASEFIQVPIIANDNTLELDVSTHQCLLSLNDVWTALLDSDIRRDDSKLIALFNKAFRPIQTEPEKDSALFYPSSGVDFITPIILGLPFCRDFYFFDHEPNRYHRSNNIHRLLRTLKKINGLSLNSSGWEEVDAFERRIKFSYRGIDRTINLVCRDNVEFIERDANLKFYFHRGDSYGEGGSGQFWDSSLLPELIKKIPSGCRCLYVTDGQPGGLLDHMKETAQIINIHEGVGGDYYFGILPNTIVGENS